MDSGQEDFVAMAEYPKPNIQGAVFSPRQFSLGMNLVECELEKEWWELVLLQGETLAIACCKY